MKDIVLTIMVVLRNVTFHYVFKVWIRTSVITMLLFESLYASKRRTPCFHYVTDCFARDSMPTFEERKLSPVLHMQQFDQLISHGLPGCSGFSTIDCRFMTFNT